MKTKHNRMEPAIDTAAVACCTIRPPCGSSLFDLDNHRALGVNKRLPLRLNEHLATSKGAADFNLHLLDIVQENMNASFDFARQLTRVTSPTQFFELSAAQARKQFETLTEQTQRLTTLVQRATTEAAQPLSGASKMSIKSS
jgi:Phasin protein